jgi:hypothetical protein
MKIEPQQPTRPVSIEERLAWWFGIYFAAQISLICHDYSPVIIFLFPAILGLVFVIPLNALPDTVSQSLAPVALPVCYALGYVFYIWHLRQTLIARNRRELDYRLLILVLAVLANELMIVGMGRITM